MDLYQLNTDRVRSLIRDQDLKQWWVAEFAGVHKTTLRRWLSGRIDRVRAENVRRLAAVLSTTDAEIASPLVVSLACAKTSLACAETPLACAQAS